MWKIRDKETGEEYEEDFASKTHAESRIRFSEGDEALRNYTIYNEEEVDKLRSDADLLSQEANQLAEQPYLKDEDMTFGEKATSYAFPFASEVARGGGSKGSILGASVADIGINALPAIGGNVVAKKVLGKGVAPYLAKGAGMLTDMIGSGAGEAGAQYAYTGEVDPLRAGIVAGSPLAGAALAKGLGSMLGTSAEKTLRYSVAKTDPLRKKISDEGVRYALDDNLVPILGGAKKLKSNIDAKLAPFIKQQDQSIQEAVEQGLEISPNQFMNEASQYISESRMSAQEREAVRQWVADEVVSQVEANGRATLTPAGVIKIRRDLRNLAEKGFTEGKEPIAVMGAESLTAGINRTLKDIIPGFKEPTEAMAPYMDVLSGATREALKPKTPHRLGNMVSLLGGLGAGVNTGSPLVGFGALGAIGGLNRLGSTVGGARLQDLGGKGLKYLYDELPIESYIVPRNIYRGEDQ